jgi:hypothetical protein
VDYLLFYTFIFGCLVFHVYFVCCFDGLCGSGWLGFSRLFSFVVLFDGLWVDYLIFYVVLGGLVFHVYIVLLF